MDFKKISVRGRMAYLLRTFENMLSFFKYEKEEWNWILEKLWQYTYIEYLDDWMYEIAEYMPESVMEDNMNDIEFISINELKKIRILYESNPIEVNEMLTILYELGTIDLYSKLQNGSPNTLVKLREGIDIALKAGVKLPDESEFEKYRYADGNGWGKPFDGREISLYLS